MPVTVVTDTTHYMPRDLMDAYGIEQVSLYVKDGDQLTRESDMADFQAFYDRLRTKGDLPTTSQPSVGDFLEVWEPILESGSDIVSVHLSGGISGTVESARQAAAEVAAGGGQRRVEVVDSKSVCAGLGFIAIAAASAARGGRDVEAVRDRAQQAADENRIWFSLDTLEYVQRGGRIGKAQAWVGGALKVKPILTMDGEVVPVERVRTSKRRFERMVELLRERHDAGATVYGIQHIQAPDEAEALAEAGREIFGSDPMVISEAGPVIGTYGGPGMLGVAGIRPELLET